MRAMGIRDRHLTADEIVARVFPTDEGGAPVPLHLAVCPACQGKVARLREAWLLDRGAVDGAVDALPAAFWNEQASEVMAAVASEAAAPSNVRPFPFSFRQTFVRRPALAFSSLAAAVALVASITMLRPASPPASAETGPPAAVTPAVAAHAPSASDQSDDELLQSVDRLIAGDSPFATLENEG